MVKPPAWWRSASVYQIYVRSFADANGDGIGDLAGITNHMGYIASLGVDAIWLNPCFPSPQRDHGYDVSDYFSIEPDYGDLSAFDAMVAAAHQHEIRVVLDVVPNHCSAQHPWFQAALSAEPGSAERERFWFRPGRGPNGDEPPNNWKAIFGGSAWTRVQEPGDEWYLGVFTAFQPDWNFGDPAVVDHFDRMLRFWFDRGVDGFRADAVIYLGKVDGLPDANESDVDSPLNPMYTYVPSQHDVWRHWRTVVNKYERDHNRELLLVAEAFSPDRPDLMVDYANPTEFHQAFAFDLMLSAWRADRIRHVITATLDALRPSGQLPAWTLNNHDTQRSATRYGRSDVVEQGGFHNGKFRISDAPVDVGLGTRRARAAAALLLALPGCVYLYAGEELGLPEVLDLPATARQDPVFANSGGEQLGRDGCRIPLPWQEAAEGSFGFSPTGSAAPWLPQPAGWGARSVVAQEQHESSSLRMYRDAGGLRRTLTGLRGDEFGWIDGLAEDLLAFRRGNVVVACNPTQQTLALPEDVVGNLTIALSSTPGHVDPTVVPANTTLWLTNESPTSSRP
jgi:alpha-glucosidase